MDKQYQYFDLSKNNCEIIAGPIKSGDAVIVFGEDVGSYEEKALIITLSSNQWESLREAVLKEKVKSKRAVGF